MKRTDEKSRYLTEADPGRAGKTRRRAKIIRILILVLLVLLACLAFLVLAFPAFRVREVTVKGADRYSEEEIISLSGISIGEEVLSLNLNAAIQNILANCPYIKSLSITSHPSGQVVLKIVEEANLMCTEKDGIYYSFSESLSVLEVKETDEGFSGFLFVELPADTLLKKGSKVTFSESGAWAKDALFLLADRIRKGPYGESFTMLSVQSERELYYVLDHRCKVVLGEAKQLEEKETLLGELLAQKGGIPEDETTIDLSDPKKIVESPGI